MKHISFRFPTSIRDIKTLWKERTSKRYRKNVEAMKKMTDFYINNILDGRWSKLTEGFTVKWSEMDRILFKHEMEEVCNDYINDLME